MAREAIESIEAIETFYMAGARATFTLKEEATFQEESFAEAFAERKLKLDTFAKINVPRPQTLRRYLLKSGVG